MRDANDFETALTEPLIYPKFTPSALGQRGLRNPWLGVAHLVAFVVCVVWCLTAAADGWRTSAVGFSSLWLLVGPALVVRWHVLLRRLVEALGPARRSDRDIVRSAQTAGRRFKWLLIAIPVLLISPTPWTESGLADALALTSAPRKLIASSILILGGITAGLGLWAGYRSIALVRALAKRQSDPGWSPLESAAGPTSAALSDFSFSSAFTFGFGGVFLLPGLLAGTLNSQLPRSALLIAVMAVIGLTTLLMTALPAVYLSARSRDERDRFVSSLSGAIEPLSRRMLTDNEVVDAEHYFRLRSLLDVRQQLLTHHSSPAAVELVRRLPLTVMLPGMSAAAAWLALL